MIRIQFQINLQDVINIVKDQWVWFIDDHSEVIEGKRNHFYGKMHNPSMNDNEEAEKRLAEWQNLQRFKIRN